MPGLEEDTEVCPFLQPLAPLSHLVLEATAIGTRLTQLWDALTDLFIPGRFPQKYRALCAADTSLASIMTGLDCEKEGE